MSLKFTVEELLNELEQNLNTIEFLHGCLTDPTYKYAYPWMTVERIERLRKIVGKRNYCLHSAPTEPGCRGCIDAAKRRELVHSVSDKIGTIEIPSSK